MWMTNSHKKRCFQEVIRITIKCLFIPDAVARMSKRWVKTSIGKDVQVWVIAKRFVLCIATLENSL